MSDEKPRHSYRQRAEAQKDDFTSTSVKIPDGVPIFQVKQAGVIRVDFIPYKVGVGNPYADPGSVHCERTYYVHRGIGPNEDSYICLAKTLNKPCPICEARAKMAKSGDDDDAQMAKQLAPKQRQLWLVHDHREPDKGVQLWDYSYHLFGKSLNARITDSDPDDEYEYFFDPKAGLVVKIGFSEETMGKNKFYEAQSIDFKKRAEPLDRNLLKHGICLDDLIIITPYDKLKAIFLQTDEHEDSQPKAKAKTPPSDDDTPPAKPAKAKPAEAPPAKAGDDDDDWGDAAPAKATPASKAAAADPEPAKPAKPAKESAKAGEAKPSGDVLDDDWDADTAPAKPAKESAKAKPAAAAAKAGDDDDW